MGRKPIPIDLAEVERLAGLGMTEAEICASLGISQDTLERRKQDSADFADAIKKGKASAGAKVANKLFEKCMRGDVSSIIWYEKTRRGLSDKLQIEKKPIPKEQLDNMSADELLAVLRERGVIE